jgi:hypothetical protein
MEYRDAPRALAAAFPEFIQAHPGFQDDVECGPTVVMGSFFHFFLESFRLASRSHSPLQVHIVDRTITFLEFLATQPNLELPNLVQVGFMEQMWQASPEEYDAIKERLGPESRKLLIATEFY